ncbi:MAG TPA: diaminopimelate epimerase [Steroidobacteraceae bacterium]|jgi:diaminopimelate epimerase|nr:diaminopimelate epimerase [Steroidobacteraceae bacterium]
MRVDFTKMHGLGNDFIVFETAAAAPQLAPEQWRQLADRHRGIGFDQGLVIEPPRRAGTAAYYRIFNADGLEVEQCGNGARCIAELLRLQGRASNGSVQMESPGGLVRARLPGDGIVAVDMGKPDFSPAASAFDPHGATGPAYELDIEGQKIHFGVVSMGNPHAVIRVPAVLSAPVARLGPLLERHAAFARRVNVGFMQVLTRDHIRLRVHERGVGETQACGTGACAAMAIGRRDGLLDAEVTVSLPGGDLIVRWQGEGEPLWLEGPATVSFTGQFDI